MLLGIVRGIIFSLVVLSYPFFIYYLLSHNLPWFGALLVSAILIWRIRSNTDRIKWIGGILIIVVTMGYVFGPGVISKSIPIAIHLTLFTVFWRSLKTTPLITQFAKLDFPQLPAGIADYCRSLTLLWAGFFAFNIVFCLWMIFASSDKFWALYNGLIVYILIMALVVGEYVWRKIKFPGLEVPSLRQSIDNIITKGPQIWNPADNQADD